MCRKFTRPKNLPLTKNLHFRFDQADIQPISLAHEVIILIRFREVRIEDLDLLVIAKFLLSSKFSAYLFTFIREPKFRWYLKVHVCHVGVQLMCKIVP